MLTKRPKVAPRPQKIEAPKFLQMQAQFEQKQMVAQMQKRFFYKYVRLGSLPSLAVILEQTRDTPLLWKSASHKSLIQGASKGL